jgi:hypothetical protein
MMPANLKWEFERWFGCCYIAACMQCLQQPAAVLSGLRDGTCSYCHWDCIKMAVLNGHLLAVVLFQVL